MGKSGFGKYKPFVLLALGMILVGFWVYAACNPESAGSGEVDVAGGIRKATERHLKISDTRIRRFVERAHRTVTVKKLELVKCRPVMIDGSDELKPDLSNLKQVEIEIRAVWDGWFHKDGETIVAYQLHPERGGKLRATAFQELRTVP